MGGIRIFILCGDFTAIKKNIKSREGHVHYGDGSYIYDKDSILATQNLEDPPVIVFQEGNAVPRSSLKSKVEAPKKDDKPIGPPNHPLENMKWETWYIPMLQGLNKQHHGRSSLGKYFNKKTIPLLIIGLIFLYAFVIAPLTKQAPPAHFVPLGV